MKEIGHFCYIKWPGFCVIKCDKMLFKLTKVFFIYNIAISILYIVYIYYFIKLYLIFFCKLRGFSRLLKYYLLF